MTSILLSFLNQLFSNCDPQIYIMAEQGFFLTVRAGTPYRHLFPSQEKNNLQCV